MRVLDNGRVIGQTSSKSWLRFRRFANPDVLDVGAPEYDVLVHLISWRNRSVSWSCLCAEGPHFSEGNSRGAGIDGVEDSFVAYLRLRDEADLGAKVGNALALRSHADPLS